MLSLIDGNRSMKEICSLSGIGDVATLKAVYVLLALRLAEREKLKPKEKEKLILLGGASSAP